MALELRQEQKQMLTQGQLQSLDILMLTNQELEGFLTEEYLENPMLECSIDKQADLIRSLEEVYEQGKTFQDHYLSRDHHDSPDIMETIDRAGRMQESRENRILEHVLSQLDLGLLSDGEQEITRGLIHLLDEKGFFPYSDEEAAGILQVPEKTAARLLSILRSLEPPGIFARDIGACLTAQLQRQGVDDPALYEMLRSCMDDVLSGRYANVTRSLGSSTAKVRE